MNKNELGNIATAPQGASAQQERNAEFGGVTIRNYTSIGKFSGIGSIEVEAREFVNLESNTVKYFIRLEGKSNDQYESARGFLIDVDDVDKLISRLQSFELITFDASRFAFSEIEYEIDDLKIVAFNDARGKAMGCISIKGASVHINPLSRMKEIRILIEKAKTFIDGIRVDTWNT